MHVFHKLLLTSVCGVVFGSLIGQGAVLAACVSGLQCEVSDGSTKTPSNDSFTSIDTSYNNAALVAINGSTIQGDNLTINAAINDHFAGLVNSGSTLELTNSTINGFNGLYLRETGSGDSHLIMNGGSVTATGAGSGWDLNNISNGISFGNAINLYVRGTGSVSVDLTNVDLSATGNALAVYIDPNGKKSFSMQGGSITAPILGGIMASGGSTSNSSLSVDLTNVTLNTGGSYGVTISGGSQNANNLKITGGSITHTSTNINGAVDFQSGGTALIDGTIIKNIGTGAAVRLMGNSSLTADLTAQGGFDFEAFANNATGLQMQNAKANLKDGTITTHGDGSAMGIWATSSSQIIADNISIETHGDVDTASGWQAFGIRLENSSAMLSNVDIKVNKTAYGIFALGNAATLNMTKGNIEAAGNNGVGAVARFGAKLSFKDATIDASGKDAYGAITTDGASLDFDNVTITSANNNTGGGGVRVQSNASATIKNNSTLTTQGAFAPALVFLGATAVNTINIDDSTVTAQDSFAVLANGGTDVLNVTNGGIIQGDRLVYAGNCAPPTCGSLFGSKLAINADDSQLFGHADVSSISTLTMNLNNDALWTIRPSSAGVVRSDVSFVNLDDATIAFDQNGSNFFQQLWVGSGNLGGNTNVWNAANDAVISLNTLLNDGGAFTNQFTDRLLIEGDISGQTFVQINQIAGSPGGWTSPSGNYTNNEGISIIQVQGKAAENSFVLDGGYVTIGGLPYAYDIYAYGPGSSNGVADSAQQLVGGTDHWDFRLQSLIATFGGKMAIAVAPQLANYLVAPNALFHAGLQDMGTLHQRLGDIRSKGHESRGEFFLRSYGGDYAYRSHLSADQYGYDADINYAALQAGGNLFGFETTNSQIRFGLSGSYGNLSFTPSRDDSQKTKMDIWNIAPYITWQHDQGAYLDVILSYGGFSGLVTTSARGRTARLQGNNFTASIEAGMPFALGNKGWSIEPQAQLIYQKLYFEKDQDIDNFPVELGSPEQTTLRVGAELNYNFTDNSKIYGKLNLIHSFHNGNQAWFGDDFEMGRGGTHLEAGLGGQITLKDKLNFYGEASWQQRTGKGGTNGLSLNVGLNFRF